MEIAFCFPLSAFRLLLSALRLLLLLAPDMPANTCQVNKVHLASPGKVGRRINSQPGKFLRQFLCRHCLPPGVEVRHVEPDHKVAGEFFVIKLLENEEGVAVAQSSVTIAAPY